MRLIVLVDINAQEVAQLSLSLCSNLIPVQAWRSWSERGIDEKIMGNLFNVVLKSAHT